MESKWKIFVIIFLSIGLIFSGIGNIYLYYISPAFRPLPPSRILVVGTYEGPSELDPVDAFQSSSEDIIIQVCEGLYQHNLSDPNLGIIPQLAEEYGTWDLTATHFTIPLRQNVTFHDGTPFNAEAVKWNFERINWFINGTGTLNSTLSQNHCLWELPNGTIILDPLNPVIVNNEYSVTINLRAPFTVIESLLCHESSYIISPETSPKYEYIHPVFGRIVGTGPFVYDYYTVDNKVELHRWDRYWGGPAFFKDVTFAVINDAVTRNNAMLDHNIEYLIGSMSSLFPTFDADPTITHRAGTQALSYYYLGMNNNKINQTWRQATSWAINYTQMIFELQDGTVFRSSGPLGPNFPMFDPTIKAATYNLTKAREIVVSMGFGNSTWTNAQWLAATFATWNFTYNIGNDFTEELLILLQENLGLIGINVIDQGLSWADFIYRPGGPFGFPTLEIDKLEFFWSGWGPQDLSPFRMMATLFSNQSNIDFYGYEMANFGQYHNHDVEMWFEQVLKEPNAVARQALYSNILHQIVEVDMPHAFGYHPYQHSVHSADIRGVPYNSMGQLYIYPMHRW